MHAPPSRRSACQQATQWPGRCSSSTGASPRQRSVAKPQRGAKLQPGGRSNSDGTMPLISFSRAPRAVALRRGVEMRDRAQQALGVGMAGIVEQVGGGRLLDLAAGVHHHDAVGVLGDHAHVVGDQHDGGAVGLLQLAHQVEDLGLDGDVERRGRLVGDQHLRIARQRHGDHDALAHAARHLVRVGVDAAFGLGDVDAAQHFDGAVHRLLARQALVQRDRLAHLAADGEQRIERGHRLLEDHRDLVAADALHLGLAELEQVLALEADGAADDAAGRVCHQAQNRQRRHALAAARFAHHAQRLAALEVIGNAVDRTHGADRGEEMGLEIDRPGGLSAHAIDSLDFIVLAFGPQNKMDKPSEHTVLGLQKTKWEEVRCRSMIPSVPA